MLWRAVRRLRHGSDPARELVLRELRRLDGLPRYSRTRVRLGGLDWAVTDPPSFAAIYRSYFIAGSHCFRCGRPDPVVVDCGANVGIGVRYWKHLFPAATVLATEPDPESFRTLKENCGSLPGVTLLHEASWVSGGEAVFSAVGGDGGFLSSVGHSVPESARVVVPTHRLRDLLPERIDLLKLDIEGAEVDVLLDCRDRLASVDRMFVEYHSFVGKPQRFDELLGVIRGAGFRFHALPDSQATQPFVERPVFNGKDLRVNLYCFRE